MQSLPVYHFPSIFCTLREFLAGWLYRINNGSHRPSADGSEHVASSKLHNRGQPNWPARGAGKAAEGGISGTAESEAKSIHLWVTVIFSSVGRHPARLQRLRAYGRRKITPSLSLTPSSSPPIESITELARFFCAPFSPHSGSKRLRFHLEA